MSDESVELRPAWRSYWGSLTLATLAFLTVAAGFIGVLVTAGGLAKLDLWPRVGAAALLVLAVLLLLGAVLGRLSNKYTVGDGRVTQHSGIVSRRQHSVRIRDLRSIELTQSLFQRLIGIGDLHFYSAGDRAEVRFSGIPDPAGLRARIDALSDRE
ncbi:MAG: PH domain-containing protein [Pseudomonadales bacterium]|jgi:uncharacterized membrane protein YdbT with pleckstrin-like domain|nr:PH domain-containing protein [Pseudomonadales bacterium]